MTVIKKKSYSGRMQGEERVLRDRGSLLAG